MQSFELKNIIEFYTKAQTYGLKTVMVSLVGLNGSSYRKPGVRMLLSSDGIMQGAISGGCVEKDIVAAAQNVFTTGTARVISYDGRYRLGCEGFLYILIEPVRILPEHLEMIRIALKNRETFKVHSYYKESKDVSGNFGSVFAFAKAEYTINPNFIKEKNEVVSSFTQRVHPDIQLVIIGTEHDAVKLCTMASFLGWKVVVVSSHKNPKTTQDFKEATEVLIESPETINLDFIDKRTAVVLMTHNFALDFQYILKLSVHQIAYIGILGSAKRKAQLENKLLEHNPDLSLDFLDTVYSPAGLDIKSETPEEIAMSITAEILKCLRTKTVTANQKIKL